MENTCKAKQCEEVLAEIYRNCQLALQSIHNILPETADAALRAEIEAQYEEYERVSGLASRHARDKGIELKEPGMMKKVMMWGSIKMSAMKDDTRSHIAEMMIQGTVMGIDALRKTASELAVDGDDDILALLDEMITQEEKFENKWKEYL